MEVAAVDGGIGRVGMGIEFELVVAPAAAPGVITPFGTVGQAIVVELVLPDQFVCWIGRLGEGRMRQHQ
jgi:hypothetical protein